VSRRAKPISSQVKELLGFEPDADDAEVLSVWKEASTRVCKPCWELKYCPYGPLVEQSPLLPPLRESAVEHNAYLVQCLETGIYGQDDKPLEPERRKLFEGMVAGFDPEDYPEHDVPAEISDMQCNIFGHICPVVFNAEGWSETSTGRRVGRNVSPPVKMRVARRDNYTCQEPRCGKILTDFEIEFDHIIPIARGGSSEEHNLRVMCKEHNRSKGARGPA
jgi:hypothetical protein